MAAKTNIYPEDVPNINQMVADGETKAHAAEPTKKERNAKFEEFDEKSPVGAAIVKGVVFATHAINTSVIEPTTSIINVLEDTAKTGLPDHPLDIANQMLKKTVSAVNDAMEPGSQNLALRDPVGDAVKTKQQELDDIRNAPSLDAAAKLGAMTGAVIGAVIDPTHGEGRAVKEVLEGITEREVAGVSTARVLANDLANKEVNFVGTSPISASISTSEKINEALAAAESVNIAKQQIQLGYMAANKRGNVFKEALDRSDGTHMDMNLGVTIAERHHFEVWNKSQAGTRADFYNKLFEERPDIALAMQKKDPTMVGIRHLISSAENDHLIGIAPYEGYVEAGVVHGYSDLEAQANKWGIEWKKSRDGIAGLADELKGGELAMNKPFFEVKKAVEAANKLDLALHQDATLRLLDPSRPMDPQLEAKVNQLLSLKLGGDVLTAESRQALPAELRYLPKDEVAKLQEKVIPLVPENLRLSAGHQQGALPPTSATHDASNFSPVHSSTGTAPAHTADTTQQMQVLRQEFLSSLVAITRAQDKATVAKLVPLSPTEIAAKGQYNALLNIGVNPFKKAGHVVADTFASDMGVGYNTGPLQTKALQKAAAGYDYDALKTAARNNLEKGATTIVMGVGLATVGVPTIAVVAGVKLAKNIIRDYDLAPGIKAFAQPALDKVGSVTQPLTGLSEKMQAAMAPQSMNQAQVNQVAQNYLDLMASLPKSADGKPTLQSLAIMAKVDEAVVSLPAVPAIIAPSPRISDPTISAHSPQDGSLQHGDER